jgi:hypothetical protein
VLAFAACYPDLVAGLMLRDSTAPAPTWTPPKDAGSYNIVGRATAVLPTLARLGGARLACVSSYGKPAAKARDEERAFCSNPRPVRTAADELIQAPTAMTQSKTERVPAESVRPDAGCSCSTWCRFRVTGPGAGARIGC